MAKAISGDSAAESGMVMATAVVAIAIAQPFSWRPHDFVNSGVKFHCDV